MAETWPKKPSNLIITLDRHFGLFLVWVPIPHIEPGIAWHIGFAQDGWSMTMGTNKWNEGKVIFDGVPLPSRDNAPEHCILPHWNLFPWPGIPIHPNLLLPVIIFLSKSKAFLAVGSVVAPKGPVAVEIPFVKVLGVNLACNDPVTMPTDIVIHTDGSTVVLGFTLGDLISALLRYAIDLLFEILMKKLMGFAGKLAKGLASRVGSKLTGRFSSGVMNRVGNLLHRWGTGAGGGAPGLIKRANLAMMRGLGRMTGNTSSRAGSSLLVYPGRSNIPGQGWLDNAWNKVTGGKPDLGFQSVADQLWNKGEKRVVDWAKKQGQSWATEQVTGPKPPGSPPDWRAGLADRVGGMIDGRSEMLP